MSSRRPSTSPASTASPTPASRSSPAWTPGSSRCEMLGLDPGDAKIFRNPGGRVTPQALEALVLGVHLLQVERILVIPHTRCAMASATLEELRERVGESAGQDASWQHFGVVEDQEAALRDDVRKVRTHPLIPKTVAVGGFLYDVDTGLIEHLVSSSASHGRPRRAAPTGHPRSPVRDDLRGRAVPSTHHLGSRDSRRPSARAQSTAHPEHRTRREAPRSTSSARLSYIDPADSRSMVTCPRQTAGPRPSRARDPQPRPHPPEPGAGRGGRGGPADREQPGDGVQDQAPARRPLGAALHHPGRLLRRHGSTSRARPRSSRCPRRWSRSSSTTAGSAARRRLGRVPRRDGARAAGDHPDHPDPGRPRPPGLSRAR